MRNLSELCLEYSNVPGFKVPVFTYNDTNTFKYLLHQYDTEKKVSYTLYNRIFYFVNTYSNKYIHVIAIVGIFGNVLTCIAIQRNKQMHNSPNYYLFSLALADITKLFLNFCEHVFNFNISSWKSDFVSVLGMACISTNIWTTVGLTVDRYIAICWPFRALKTCTLSRAVKINCAVWIISTVFSCARYLEWEYKPSGLFGDSARIILSMDAVIIHSFLIPLLIIICAYTCIVLTIWKSAKLRTECSSGEQKSRGLVLSVSVVLQFLICWGGHHTYRMLIKYSNLYDTGISADKVFALFYTTKTINLLSALIDPLIYTCVSPEFRKAYKKILYPSICKTKWKKHHNMKELNTKVLSKV